MSVLKKPFRIELRKTPVVASYRAHLIGVSAHQHTYTTASFHIMCRQLMHSRKRHRFQKPYCVDDFYANPRKLPCGMQYDDKKRPVWDSQVTTNAYYAHNSIFNSRSQFSRVSIRCQSLVLSFVTVCMGLARFLSFWLIYYPHVQCTCTMYIHVHVYTCTYSVYSTMHVHV